MVNDDELLARELAQHIIDSGLFPGKVSIEDILPGITEKIGQLTIENYERYITSNNI
jgi:hypothetical protein